MTNTDFILSRLRTTLALHRLIRFGVAFPTRARHGQPIPLRQVHYSGFSLRIGYAAETPRSGYAQLRLYLGKLWSWARQLKWPDSPWARVLLHCGCVLRHGQVRWHGAGIWRELQAIHRRPGQRSSP
jgi:hypothetical protein